MSKINSGLGMGLQSLIPAKKIIQDQTQNLNQAGEIGERILEIEVEKISPNPYQPRKRFDQGALEDLAASIKEQGMLQPLVVTKTGDDSYELVAGERRLKASKIAGLKKVPVIVREFSSLKKMEAAFVENVQRENLNPIEEARVYQNLKDEFDLTLDEIAQSVSKSKETVSGAFRILSLPAEVQRFVAEGKVSKSQANIILKLENIEEQILLAKKIVNEGLSVKEAEKIAENKISAGLGTKKIGVKNIDSRLSKIEEELAEVLKTKVRIIGKPEKGKIVIEFFSEEELDLMIDRIEK